MAVDFDALLALQALEAHPRLAISLRAALAERLRYAFELRHDATALDVPARLARVLLRLAIVEDGSDTSARSIPTRLTPQP